MAALIKKLLADGKTGEMMRVLDDETYRKSLYKKYVRRLRQSEWRDRYELK